MRDFLKSFKSLGRIAYFATIFCAFALTACRVFDSSDAENDEIIPGKDFTISDQFFTDRWDNDFEIVFLNQRNFSYSLVFDYNYTCSNSDIPTYGSETLRFSAPSKEIKTFYVTNKDKKDSLLSCTFRITAIRPSAYSYYSPPDFDDWLGVFTIEIDKQRKNNP